MTIVYRHHPREIVVLCCTTLSSLQTSAATLYELLSLSFLRKGSCSCIWLSTNVFKPSPSHSLNIAVSHHIRAKIPSCRKKLPEHINKIPSLPRLPWWFHITSSLSFANYPLNIYLISLPLVAFPLSPCFPSAMCCGCHLHCCPKLALSQRSSTCVCRGEVDGKSNT